TPCLMSLIPGECSTSDSLRVMSRGDSVSVQPTTSKKLRIDFVSVASPPLPPPPRRVLAPFFLNPCLPTQVYVKNVNLFSRLKKGSKECQIPLKAASGLSPRPLISSACPATAWDH
ncbi:hypothetical protein J6590_057920, partial [Homalodisca vitripennis]